MKKRKLTAARLTGLAALLFGATTLTSCQSNGFASSLSLTGAETQRDLAHDVRRTLEAQEACQTQFGRAFEQLSRLQQANEEEVDGLYQDLQDGVDDCAERVRSAGAHIAQLRESGASLFADWSTELDEFVSPRMRARSESRLHEAQRRLDDLLVGLERAQVQMEEILMLQRDFVLYFNHNLSAHSIESLRDENEHFHERMRLLADEFTEVRRAAEAFVVELNGAPVRTVDAG